MKRSQGSEIKQSLSLIVLIISADVYPSFHSFPSFLSFDMEIAKVMRDCVTALHFPFSVLFNLYACLFLSPFLLILHSNTAYQGAHHYTLHGMRLHHTA